MTTTGSAHPGSRQQPVSQPDRPWSMAVPAKAISQSSPIIWLWTAESSGTLVLACLATQQTSACRARDLAVVAGWSILNESQVPLEELLTLCVRSPCTTCGHIYDWRSTRLSSPHELHREPELAPIMSKRLQWCRLTITPVLPDGRRPATQTCEAAQTPSSPAVFVMYHLK